jgi:hypothetical protein
MTDWSQLAIDTATRGVMMSSNRGDETPGPRMDFHGPWKNVDLALGAAVAIGAGVFADKMSSSVLAPNDPSRSWRFGTWGMSVAPGVAVGAIVAGIGWIVGGRTGGVMAALGGGAVAGSLAGATLAL